MSKLLKVDFISKSNQVHNNKYDYSKVEYINTTTKVCIICPEHGEFWQTPKAHMKGQGCPSCKGGVKMTQSEFIRKASELHNNKYDYSKVNYVNSRTKVCIICPNHGEFWQTPRVHLQGHGCNKCTLQKRPQNKPITTEEFIKRSKIIYGDKYDYSKVEYTNANTPVCIICPKHGEFWIKPHYHTTGTGCKMCGIEKTPQRLGMGNDEFVKRSKIIHGDKYDYSKVNYVNNHTKVCIICPKHGEFWQIPKEHLNGCGCPVCNSSHLENQVFNLLKNNGYTFEVEKTFDWLKNKYNLYLDFFIPKLNLAIECQGIQHFQQVRKNDELEFEKRKQRDKYKYKLCKEHNIDIIYFSNLGIDYPYDVIEDIEELYNRIKNYGM